MAKKDSRIIQKRIVELKRKGNSAADIRNKLKINSEYDYHLIVLEMIREVEKNSKTLLKHEYTDAKDDTLREIYVILETGLESYYEIRDKFEPIVGEISNIQKLKASMKYQRVLDDIFFYIGICF